MENKPVSHLDSLLLLIVPLLGKVKVPTEPEKLANLFGLKEKPQISKHLLDILLDMILLPYRYVFVNILFLENNSDWQYEKIF